METLDIVKHTTIDIVEGLMGIVMILWLPPSKME
jgi:hypothetical protein